MTYTTGTTNFNLDLNELVEEAFERCGQQLRSGYDLRTARRSLNLLTIEWINRGINLWTIEQGQIPININGGQISYPLPIDTVDLLDQVIRTGEGQNQVDINISRISESTYSSIPTKNAYGRPIQVWIDRQSGTLDGGTNLALVPVRTSGAISATDTTITLNQTDNFRSQGYVNIDNETILYQNISGNQLLNCYRGVNGTTAASHADDTAVLQNYLPNVNIWPTGTPGQQYTLIYYRMRRINDAGFGSNVQEIPFRWLPVMVAGLAYMLSMKLPDVDPQRILGLKAAYEEVFQQAAEEDRDKSNARFVPRNLYYSR